MRGISIPHVMFAHSRLYGMPSWFEAQFRPGCGDGLGIKMSKSIATKNDLNEIPTIPYFLIRGIKTVGETRTANIVFRPKDSDKAKLPDGVAEDEGLTFDFPRVSNLADVKALSAHVPNLFALFQDKVADAFKNRHYSRIAKLDKSGQPSNPLKAFTLAEVIAGINPPLEGTKGAARGNSPSLADVRGLWNAAKKLTNATMREKQLASLKAEYPAEMAKLEG
jgi:hypothetical protein